MTDEERTAFITYLVEQRRHLLAEVAACERLLAVLKGKVGYNNEKPDTTTLRETVSVTSPLA